MGLAGGLATNGSIGGGSGVAAVAFGTAAARPAAAAGNSGTAYFATDTGEVTFSNGATWSAIAQTSASTLTLPGFISMTTTGVNGRIAFPNNVYFVSGAAGQLSLANSYLDVASAGFGLRVAEGANCKQGTAVLVAGSVVVANTSVTANSRILLTSNADGGTPGWLRVSARVAGTSFTITSSSGTDTSTVAYQIFEPG